MKVYFFTAMLMLILGSSAYAMKLTNESSSVSSERAASTGLVSKEVHASDDSDGLRSGVISDINFQKGTMLIHGSQFKFNVNNVKVFIGSHASDSTLLAKGKKIRFLLDASDKTHKTIAVVYLN